MIFISPPFGKYLKFKKAISINGSYTLNPRRGLLIQILKTLRYSYKYSGWVNKIGLRNPGIQQAIDYYDNSSVISIALLEEGEIPQIIEKIPKHMNIELNISCPNAGKKMIDVGIEKFLNEERKWCILKLPLTISMDKIDEYYRLGFRQFHCCNTYPVEEGGVSGRYLMPHSLRLIERINEKYDDVVIIGGGGIQSKEDIEKYSNAGAKYYSISTLLFNPWKFAIFYMDYLR